jgi:hypothetical protein
LLGREDQWVVGWFIELEEKKKSNSTGIKEKVKATMHAAHVGVILWRVLKWV